jgi:hypothetical protein
MARPWMKFYPSDWRADPALRMCSLGARGLWAELMCIMHEAEPYGFLLVNGLPMNEKQIASLAGAPLRETVNYIAELESCGVFSRSPAGVIYSRRMKRDQEKAEKDKANGKGGGNPNIKLRDNVGVNPKVNVVVKPGDKAQIPDTRTQKEDDDEDTPEPLISDASNELADEITAIVGHDLSFVPPRWYGASWIVQKWLNEGWKREIILASVQEQMSRRKGDPPDRITYFEKGIAATHARHAAPLPTAKIIEGETVNVVAHAKDRSLSSFARQAAEFAHERAQGDSVRNEGGGGPIRLIPGGKST